jgi:hypothetical protein
MDVVSSLIENTYGIKEIKVGISSLQIRNITKCIEGKQGQMWNLKPKSTNARCCCVQLINVNTTYF